MTALLTEIAAPEDPQRRLRLRVRTARVVVLIALCVGALVAAAILHGLDRETAAAWFTGMGEALFFGVCGLVVGETLGALSAERLLLDRRATTSSQ